MNDNLIQFSQEKILNFLYCEGFTDEELKFFAVNFEISCIFRGNFEFGPSIGCR